jgi:hypothetical protein
MIKIKFKGAILSDINKIPDSENKNDILLKIKEMHQPSDNYGENGYRFPDEWIEQIGGIIIQMPLECIADYILLTDKKGIDNKNEKIINGLKTFIKNSDLFYYFQKMKPDILGALAYGILNVNDDEAVYCATKVLNMYFDWYMYASDNNREGIRKMVDEHKKWLLSLN